MNANRAADDNITEKGKRNTYYAVYELFFSARAGLKYESLVSVLFGFVFLYTG